MNGEKMRTSLKNVFLLCYICEVEENGEEMIKGIQALTLWVRQIVLVDEIFKDNKSQHLDKVFVINKGI